MYICLDSGSTIGINSNLLAPSIALGRRTPREVVGAILFFMVHELKTWPTFYQAVEQCRKTFEVRKDDRFFVEGDILHLREWDAEKEEYTGKSLFRKVCYVLPGGEFGIEAGYVVLGLTLINF